LAEALSKPFVALGNRLVRATPGGRPQDGMASSMLLGVATGLLWAPCAGPILGLVLTGAALSGPSAHTTLLLFAYAAGAATSLAIAILAGGRVFAALKKSLGAGEWIRRGLGVAVLLAVLGIALGWDTSILARLSESGTNRWELSLLEGTGLLGHGKSRAAPALPTEGNLPSLAGATGWINSPPLTVEALRGKVVVIDFWTYSCINCQRALPHVEGWYNDYKKDGFVVVGVSTPEFAFEHVVSNVRSAAGSLGIDYPVAIDNNYGTWDAYNNEYWPADYLIDPTGEVRAYDFGEGGYSTMESDIRQLLSANGTKTLPPRTDVADKTPTNETTPESYVGYQEEQYEVGTAIVHNRAIDYHAPSSVPTNSFAFNGTWTDHSQEATAGSNATINLHFVADDVYLVMSGTGTVSVTFDGRHLASVKVGGVPRLYTLFSGNSLQTGQLSLSFTPGVQAYDFTFG
jgi:thiol-disulfide isomerase/thioredoxin